MINLCLKAIRNVDSTNATGKLGGDIVRKIIDTIWPIVSDSIFPVLMAVLIRERRFRLPWCEATRSSCISRISFVLNIC